QLFTAPASPSRRRLGGSLALPEAARREPRPPKDRDSPGKVRRSYRRPEPAPSLSPRSSNKELPLDEQHGTNPELGRDHGGRVHVPAGSSGTGDDGAAQHPADLHRRPALQDRGQLSRGPGLG